MRNCLALLFVIVLTSCAWGDPPTPEACTQKCYDQHAQCMEGVSELKQPEASLAITRFCQKTLPNCTKQCPLAKLGK